MVGAVSNCADAVRLGNLAGLECLINSKIHYKCPFQPIYRTYLNRFGVRSVSMPNARKTEELVKRGKTTLPPNPVGEHMAQPRSTQTKDYMHGDVAKRSNTLASLPQIHRFIAKC